MIIRIGIQTIRPFHPFQGPVIHKQQNTWENGDIWLGHQTQSQGKKNE